MVARSESEPAFTRNRTTLERKSDREMVVTRIFDAPARLVFEAWTTPELFKQWWVPKSSGATLLSCEQDVRVGGSYRLEFAHPKAATPMAFFGRYLEVVPNARLVWTNEESADGAVTTVTFEENGRQDAAGDARALSVEGSARHGHRGNGRGDARDVRAVG